MTLQWKRIDASRFDDLLCALPPAAHTSRGFLVGEVYDHFGPNGTPRFTACMNFGDDYFEACRPITRTEFHAATQPDILANLEA